MLNPPPLHCCYYQRVPGCKYKLVEIWGQSSGVFVTSRDDGSQVGISSYKSDSADTKLPPSRKIHKKTQAVREFSIRHLIWVFALCGLFTKRTYGTPVAVIREWLATCPHKNCLRAKSWQYYAPARRNIPNKSIRQWLAVMSLTLEYQWSYT